MHWRRKWQPTPVLLPGESQGRAAWLASIYGIAQSRTRLKRLSSSSSSSACLQLPQHQTRIRKLSLSPDSGLPITASCWQNLTGRALAREPEMCLIPGPNRKEQSTEGWVGDHKSITSVHCCSHSFFSSLLASLHPRGRGKAAVRRGP